MSTVSKCLYKTEIIYLRKNIVVESRKKRILKLFHLLICFFFLLSCKKYWFTDMVYLCQKASVEKKLTIIVLSWYFSDITELYVNNPIHHTYEKDLEQLRFFFHQWIK